jgi:dephospho-CoA kinase
LLFETGGEKDFDKVIVVSAPVEVQRARVLARRDMTPAKLQSILERQMPDEEKRRRADFVIDTGADLSTTEAEVGDILDCLGLRSGR